MKDEQKFEKKADDIFEKECSSGYSREATLERSKLKLWHRYGYIAGLKAGRGEREKVINSIKLAKEACHEDPDAAEDFIEIALTLLFGKEE
jgi:hypothetical protein